MADQEPSQLPAKPHFLQPVLSDLATNFLIPVDFIKYLEGERREDAQLRCRLRKQPWAVRIVGRRVVDGWEEFVRENDLHVGEFLVFRYEGNMVFDVIVFGRTACEREYPSLSAAPPPAPVDDDDVMVVEEDARIPVMEEIRRRRSYSSHKAGTDSFVGTMRQSSMRHLYIPRAFVKAHELVKATSGILMKDENGKIWPMGLFFKKGTYEVYTKSRGWISFIKENSVKVGQDFEVRFISEGIKPVLAFRRLIEQEKAEMPEHGSEGNADQVFEPEIEVGNLAKRQKAEKVPETPANIQKVMEVPETEEVATIPATRMKLKDNKSKTSNCDQKNYSSSAGGSPYFYQTSTWPSIARSKMNVHIEFVRTNDLTDKCGNIILKNLEGELWPAKLVYERKRTQDCYYIGLGWKEFALSNGLGVGCRFKLEMEQPENKMLTFKLCECKYGKLKYEDDA